MKTVFSLALLLSLAVGCGDNKSSSQNATNTASSSGNPLTAPVDYLAAAGKAQQKAVKTVDTTTLNQAIQLFNVDKGRNPKDLNELVEQKYIPQLPTPPYGMKLDYDPTAGKVTVVKQ